MIGRRFFNDIVLNLINEILKNAGCIISFEKIQQDVVYDLVKKTKKIISYVLGTNCFEKGFIIFKFLFKYLILFYYLK